MERLRRIEDEEFKKERRGEREKEGERRESLEKEGGRGGEERRRRVIYIGRVTGGTFTPDKGQFSPHFCLI